MTQKRGSGLIGLLLSVALIRAVLYVTLQSQLTGDDNQDSTYELGIEAINEAEEVRGLI